MSKPSLQQFLSDNAAVMWLMLTGVNGSSPRNPGTEMFVAATGLWGTIGGGQLEYRAIKAAREMLCDGKLRRNLNIPLGPEIGQCCGGRVELRLMRMRSSDKQEALFRARKAHAAWPHVYLMGAGHVGRALADQFQHLPVKCLLIDPRPDEIARNRADVETRISVLPEAEIRNAPAGSAFVVLTHDHGLDFLLASAALARRDAAYIGMIGSASKRAMFRNWARQNHDGQTIERLNCPIGANGSRDKRPSVIAAFVVAEVMAELTSETSATAPTEKKRRCRASNKSGKGCQPDRVRMLITSEEETIMDEET